MSDPVEATPRQLGWRRFRRHRLGFFCAMLLLAMYITAYLSDFVTPYATDTRNVSAINAPPMSIHFIDKNGQFHFRPFVYGWDRSINPDTWAREYRENPELVFPIRFFSRCEPYKLWGLIPLETHLFTVQNDQYIHLFGTDPLGRDMFSRVIHGARISLSIGLIGATLTLFFGVLLGGLSGYLGGWTDRIIQRIIEVLQSIPHLPIWMALSAALPVSWSPLLTYFGVTIILSLLAWPGLARQVRGRFLALREEEFVVAARLLGARKLRVIFRHMLPNFLSHTITIATLAVPAMILGETALSFLGIGLRPPVVSWGVLLQQAQNYQVIVMSPWLLIPGLFVVVTVMAFNLMGDGLRDAADPYSTQGQN